MPKFSLFIVAVFILAFVPGPSNIQVLVRGIAQGPLAGLVSALGCAAGNIFQTLLVALGVATLLRHSPILFDGLKLIGGAYLMWLGLKMILSRAFSLHAAKDHLSLRTVFWQSVISSVLNPKVIVFFVLFLPQFVNIQGSQSVLLQMVELGLVFMLVTTIVFSLIGICAGSVGRWLKKNQRAEQWVNRLAGVALLGIGLKLAISH